MKLPAFLILLWAVFHHSQSQTEYNEDDMASTDIEYLLTEDLLSDTPSLNCFACTGAHCWEKRTQKQCKTSEVCYTTMSTLNGKHVEQRGCMTKPSCMMSSYIPHINTKCCLTSLCNDE